MDQKNQKPRLSVTDIQSHKNKDTPMVWLTAYSAPMAHILDPHCDVLLVGDSMGTALYGMENTLGVNLDMMIAHGKAVMRQAKTSAVVIDMPYGSFEDGPEFAYQNAKRLLEETGCDAVKIEGGAEIQETIVYLVGQGIQVMAHIGLKPQSVVKDGGYKVKGKTDDEAASLLHDAKVAEQAGAFALLIEGTVEPVSRMITENVSIPTVGIGASAACDGQVLVTEDMLGLFHGHVPKFVKQYAALDEVIGEAVKNYAADVRSGAFPASEHTYLALSKDKN